MAKLLQCLATLLLAVVPASMFAEPARFDLIGPRIDIRVTRSNVTLPIASVPNLQAGDKIWLHPALPSTQSVKYLLIAAFLRGTTNPPPDEWFTRIETWKKNVREEGVTITVPAEAQQAVLFLAPETGGDYSTLRSSVRGRPGIFVRASQDLTEAGFEQARIEKYLAELKQVPSTDQAALQNHSNLLARTLNLRPNPDCAKRPVDQQYTCLTQSGSQMLLDDGHAQSVVAALSSGPGSDFITAASYTGVAGGGTYSAYVGAIVDFVRILNGVHTAQYQYIPAIAFPENESLNLRLNTAPSFHNPKSVIVIGLPAIQPATSPPLRTVEPNHIACLLQPSVVLPIEGAPLVFSTAFAHDLTLHLSASLRVNGKPAQDFSMVPDAFQGGLVISASDSVRKELPLPPTPIAAAPLLKPGEPLTGTIKGYWGFDPFTGPVVPLQGLPGEDWRILTSPETPGNLIAGQANHLQLVSSGTACVQAITLEPSGAKTEWKLEERLPHTALTQPLEVTLDLKHTAKPGSIQLAIQQYGRPKPDQLDTETFSEPAHVDALLLHANDRSLTLTGRNLEGVKQIAINTLIYIPQAGASEHSAVFSLPENTKAPSGKTGEAATAHILLADGRTLDCPLTILPPRPLISLLNKHVTLAAPSPIRISSPDDLPLGATLTFFLKSESKFPRDQQIEIASLDDAVKTTLSVSAGSLMLQDSRTVLATLDPLKIFGTSAFGPLHLRAVAADGTLGEWLPLATLVRLPALTDLHCPADPARTCQLNGTGLYLIDAVSTNPAFSSPALVPEAFVETTLTIPHPVASSFYLRLRDDPATANQVTLPILPETVATK